MKSVIGLMEESVILSEQDISRFRQYIDRKYEKDTSRMKAEVLADVIQRMVEPHLEGIERTYRKPLKDAIFTNTVAKQKNQICKKDIFAELLLLDLDETKLLDNAWRWLKANVWSQIAYDSAMDLVKGLQSPVGAMNPSQAGIFGFSGLLQTKENQFLRYLLSGIMGLSILLLGIWAWQLMYSSSLPMDTLQGQHIIHTELPNKMGQAYEESVLYEVSKSAISSTSTVKPEVFVPSKTASISHPYEYVSFNEEKLRGYLVKKNSLLAEAPYFETIMDVAKDHNLDPRLLFAIAGQEQGLVNKQKSYALKAANNPFNVYGSWVKYNTNIEDSSRIVSNTLIKRLSKKPKQMDELVWINKKYAADPNWSRGVKRYYRTLVANSR